MTRTMGHLCRGIIAAALFAAAAHADGGQPIIHGAMIRQTKVEVSFFTTTS